jgi:hypothetical protein
LEFPFTEVWKEVERMMWIRKYGESKSIEEDFRTCCSIKEALKIITLLRNISWGVWLARILKFFEDKQKFPLKSAF